MVHAQQKGFTIVELLIVIVVIGILAAITIVAFNGIQNRANDTAVQNDLKNFASKMEIAKTDDPNSAYVTASNIAATGVKFTKSAYLPDVNNLLYCRQSDGSGYVLLIRSKSNKIFYTSSNQGIKEYTAWTGSGSAACTDILPGSTGIWGLQTNWAQYI